MEEHWLTSKAGNTPPRPWVRRVARVTVPHCCLRRQIHGKASKAEVHLLRVLFPDSGAAEMELARSTWPVNPVAVISKFGVLIGLGE